MARGMDEHQDADERMERSSRVVSEEIARDFRGYFYLLQGAVGFICSLRALRRQSFASPLYRAQRELAIRVALGAARWRLIRQLLGREPRCSHLWAARWPCCSDLGYSHPDFDGAHGLGEFISIRLDPRYLPTRSAFPCSPPFCLVCFRRSAPPGPICRIASSIRKFPGRLTSTRPGFTVWFLKSLSQSCCW